MSSSNLGPIFGGIEGGGSSTNAVILNASGTVIGRASGGGSNGWTLGVPAAAAVQHDLLIAARRAAGLPGDAPLAALGVCGSGFLQASQQEALEVALRAREPKLAESYYVDNDSPGSLSTAAGDAGGMVIIAGTGSMGQVATPDASARGGFRTRNCGGWGDRFGDEGSAYAIALRAIRGIFHFGDHYAPAGAPPAPDATNARAAMLKHFGIADVDGMLDVFYGKFEKARVAGFAAVLAQLANAGDAFALAVFSSAGAELGDMARTLAGHLGPSPASAPQAGHPTRIVCVGSVWKSWPLMRSAFIASATAKATGGGPPPLPSFELVRLIETSAVGAAWLAARDADARKKSPTPSLTLDHERFVERIYLHSAVSPSSA